MAVNPREWWTQRRKDLAIHNVHMSPSFMIPSVVEKNEHKPSGSAEDVKTDDRVDDRVAKARHCTQEGVKAGVKAGSIACVASAIPTLTAVRTIPWAKANVNYTGQALIISAATIAAYFITTEQTILECSRSNSYAAMDRERAAMRN